MSEAPEPKPVDVKDLRRRLGEPDRPMSQPALAAMLSINQSTISRFETDPEMQKGPIAVLLRKIDDETPEPEWAKADESGPQQRAAAQ
jgi:DNA-binding transcriptional regulator YiaG